MKIPYNRKNTIQKYDPISNNIIIILASIIILTVSGIGIGVLASELFTYDSVGQILVHARSGQPYKVAPEPVERTIYMVLAGLAPIALVLFFWRSEPYRQKARVELFVKPVNTLLPIMIALALIAPFWGAEFIDLLFFPTPWAKEHKTVITFISVGVATALVYHSQIYTYSKDRAATILWWTIIAFAIALQILPYRIVSINSVTLSPIWSVHFDAATYALNQVVHGKTLIADLPSQYGLFPELIAPIFKLTGLSVFKESLFFAFLHALALLAIAALLYRHIRNRILSTFIFLSFSATTCLFMYLNGFGQDIYIQYFPIRFFWPAVGLLFFSVYSKSQTKILLCVLGLICGIAVIWNLDTGIPVLISIGATLLVKPLITRRSAPYTLIPAIVFSAVSISIIGLCFSLLRLKAGTPLELNDILAYQKIFYMTGFGMLPMPLTLHPWQAILIIYLAGMVTALSGWRQEQSRSSTHDLLFCAAIMGLGLFAYYQGRSHVYCLILVTWPAVLISGILANLILRSVRKKSTQRESIVLAVPLVIFFTLGGIVFITSCKNMLTDMLNNFYTRNLAKDPIIADELQFMRNTYKGRNCLILSQRQAIYSAELGIQSPINGPGIAETLLQSDLDNLVNSALSTSLQCIYLGLSEGSITFIDVKDAALMQKYPVITKSQLGTMVLLEPNPQNNAQNLN